jgi:N-methylhydantoinase A
LRHLELRYVGQGYELAVPCPDTELTDADKAGIGRRFHELHEKIYGHAAPDSPIELVNCRVDSVAPLPKLKLPKIAGANGAKEPVQPKWRRKVYFAEAGGFADTPVYDRQELRAGDRIVGPAIIEQADATTVLLPRQGLETDAHGDLILSFAAGAHVH